MKKLTILFLAGLFFACQQTPKQAEPAKLKSLSTPMPITNSTTSMPWLMLF